MKFAARHVVILTVAIVAASRALGQPAGPPPGPPPGAPPSPAGDPAAAEDGKNYFLSTMMPPLPADAPKPPAQLHDLQGTWYHRELLEPAITRSMYGKKLQLKPAAQAILDHRTAAEKQGRPIANASTLCIPPGHTWQLDLNFPFTIINDGDRVIYFVFEEFHGIWKIRMNQPHRAAGEREYMGDSVGRWDGDTLVVDTIAFKQPLWLDVTGLPASKDVRLIHRIRRIDEGGPALEIITTVDDPTMYAAPWSMVRTFAWRPDKAVFDEYNCEKQVGGDDGVSRYGVTVEQ